MLLLSLLTYSSVVFAVAREGAPTVPLDKATVIGKTNGTVTSYYGIPYAHSPYVFHSQRPLSRLLLLIEVLQYQRPPAPASQARHRIQRDHQRDGPGHPMYTGLGGATQRPTYGDPTGPTCVRRYDPLDSSRCTSERRLCVDMTRIVVLSSETHYLHRSVCHRTDPGWHQAGSETACTRSRSFHKWLVRSAHKSRFDLQYIYGGGFTSGSTAGCVYTLSGTRTDLLTDP